MMSVAEKSRRGVERGFGPSNALQHFLRGLRIHGKNVRDGRQEVNQLRAIVVFLMATLAFHVLANPSSKGVIFIPLNPGTIRGAHGSVWTTTLVAYNPTDLNVYLARYGYGCSGEGSCPVIPPHTTMTLDAPALFFPQNGLLLEECIPRLLCDASELALTLRTRDVSRSAENSGTDIPLPTPSDFRSETLVIIDVPNASNVRNTLRVYWFGAPGPVPAHAVVFDGSTGAQLFEATVPSAAPASYVNYAEIALPSLASAASLRVEFAVPTPPAWTSARAWGFMSSTNNDTNLITISVPHHPELVPGSVASSTPAPGSHEPTEASRGDVPLA